ncbi:MAG: tetratricopeptide repeat protein, partial [Planctomycetota bacterium]
QRYDEALLALEYAETLAGEDRLHFVYAKRGRIFEDRGDFENAVRWYRKAIDCRDDDNLGYIYMGGMLARRGKLAEAEQCHRKAIQCAEGYIDEAYLNLGYVLRAQERFTEALECFGKALELNPQYEQAETAIEDMRAVLDYLENAQPRETDVMPKSERLAESRNAGDDGLTALASILTRELIADYEDYGPGYAHYGTYLIELARYEEAKEAIERAIELCPDHKLHMPYCQMGYVYEFRGDFEEAGEWFKKAVGLRPHDAEVHAKLGFLLARQGKLKEAEQCYITALECPEGELDEVYLNFAFVLRSQERFDEALKYFEAAFESDPECGAAELGVKDMKLVKAYLETHPRESKEGS